MVTQAKDQMNLELAAKIKQLQKSSNVQNTIEILGTIQVVLRDVDLLKIANPLIFLIEFIKPIAREAANISVSVFPQSKQLLQSIFYQVTILYARSSRNCLLIDGFELLKELLARSTQIFKAKVSAAVEPQDGQQDDPQQQLKQLQWIRDYVKMQKTDKTSFFYKCCNQIIIIFEGIESKFKQTSINFVKQYFLFVDYIQWFIKRQKIQEMVVNAIDTLQQMFTNYQNYKQFTKDINFDSSERLSIAINKTAKQIYSVGLKKRVELLSSVYALNLVFNPSIEKKINGLKILNKWARHFTANPSSNIKEQQYCRWLVDNKVIDLIMENGKNFTIVKTCNDMIRLLIRRKCLGEQYFHKLFECIQNNSVSETRQLIFKYMDMEAIKLQYSDYQLVFDKLKNVQKGGDFYEEQMFSFLIQIFRYSSYHQNKKAVAFMGDILKKNWGKFRNDRIENKCMNCFVKAASKMIERKSTLEERMQDIIAIYDDYMTNPSSLSIKVMKNIILGLPDVAYISKNKVAFKILEGRPILFQGINLIAQKVIFQEELESFLCFLLTLAKDVYHEKLIFEDESFFKATKCPKIFHEMLLYIDYTQDVESLFEKLVSRFQVDTYEFKCLKYFFYRLNTHQVRKIHQPYAYDEYELMVNASQLKGFEHMNYLLRNARTAAGRDQIANFISDLYTTYQEQSTKQGQQQLILAMKKIIKSTIQSYNEQKWQIQLILTNLASIQYLMMATETLGVGSLQAHNSLVATSTVTVKVYNQITDYNDVLKVFEKKMPSNTVLFQLIQQLSRQFKCSPCQIMFRQGANVLPDKWNGLTLQQIQVDGKILSAVKSFRQRIRRQKLIIGDQLTPKAKAVFEDIYNTFAVNGKMGKRECANYVQGVTRTSCFLNDYRVHDFFREWDSDNDQNITLEDFLKFYKVNCAPLKDEIVWKNLTTMKFRKNLKKYDEAIQPPANQLLFRFYLSQSEQIYKILFNLAQNQNQQLKQRSMRLLFRLPTCSFTMESLGEDLKLAQKNPFETQYLLMAIVYRLSSTEDRLDAIKSFIAAGNAKSIFQMILRIDKHKSPSKEQLKCLYISLQILRSLNTVPDLRSVIEDSLILNDLLELPETNLFFRLIQISLQSMDFQTLQSALALQISQPKVQIQGIIEAAFHNEVQIRKMVCNYVFICEKISKNSIDLFNIPVKSNCEYWFSILTKIIIIKEDLDFESILANSMATLASRSETVEKNEQDLVIFGNLNIISSIILTKKANPPQNFIENILILAKKLISVRNRNMVYNILATQDVKLAVSYILQLLNSVPTKKQISKKQYFVGIKNLGSTCYMNSILQMLFNIKQFKNLIFSVKIKQDLMKTQFDGLQIYDDVLYQLQKMYTYLQMSTRGYYYPKQFCLTIKHPQTKQPINPNIQQDVHEFIARFLQSLQNYMKNSGQLDKFKQIFEGKTLTQFTCKECHNKITRQQNFCQLSLQVKNIQTLSSSFDKFIQPQQISDYFCEPCQKKVQKIQRSTFLSSMPKIMIINLRRIIFDLQSFQNVKVDSTFKFPEELDVSDYVSKQATNVTHDDFHYTLKGIVVHSGTSQSGHYYSIIKDQNQWYKFNDQTVTKFDLKDLPRQAYGGTQTQDQWSDELKFSTNAYILFYEKNSKVQQQAQVKISQQFATQIQTDNQLFFNQLQVHQSSVFDFAISLYQRYRPHDINDKITKQPFEEYWDQDPNIFIYELMYDLMQRLLYFMQTFYDVKVEIIYKIGAYLYELYYLLPEKSYTFLHELEFEQSIQGLCLHNDEHIRSLYSSLISKCLHVYSNFYALNINDVEVMDDENSKIVKLLDNFYSYWTDDRLLKNIYKSSKYFEMWRVCSEFIPEILHYLLSKQTIVVIVDLLMGNDSPRMKDKKVPQIPQVQSIPLIQILSKLMSFKKNLVDYINPQKQLEGVVYMNLTDKQKQMMGNVNFYRKMIKNKTDNDLLAAITGKLAENDGQFSKKLVQIFLKGLNCSYDEIEASLLMINHLKEYLLIEDEYTEQRMKWVLGIPQLQIGDDMNYGVRYSDQSTVYSYVSSLYFVQNDQFQPALHVLFLKRSIYSQFSIAGVSLLLELLCKSEKAFNYLMNLPAPNYTYRSYPDWIWQFIMKLKDEDSYYLQINKTVAFNSLMELYNKFEDKLKQSQLDLPVNKFIIGTNKQCPMVASLGTQHYQMALWAHNTYVLQNLPTGTMNKSLPKNLFKFAEPTEHAQYFVCLQRKKQLPQNPDLLSMFTVFTLFIDSKQNLLITFKFKNFTEQISFQRGKTQINFAYQQITQQLHQYLDISILKSQQNEMMSNDKNVTNNEIQFPTIEQHLQGSSRYNSGFGGIGMQEKSCPQCTYINFGKENCEMCDAKLYTVS